MPAAAPRTPPACGRADAEAMDAVAIVVAIALFAALVALVEGLDRV